MIAAKRLSRAQVKSKCIALLIEHAPCCGLSAMANFVHIPAINHNPKIELGFAIGGALVGEYMGQRFLHDAVYKRLALQNEQELKHTLKCYTASLAIGLATWGIHQKLFHYHHDHDDHAAISSPVRQAIVFSPHNG